MYPVDIRDVSFLGVDCDGFPEKALRAGQQARKKLFPQGYHHNQHDYSF